VTRKDWIIKTGAGNVAGAMVNQQMAQEDF